MLSLLVALGGALVLLRFLPRLPGGRNLVLTTELSAGTGFASPPATDHAWLGKRGETATPLRPAGFAHIEGERVDVVSDGDFIAAGEPIEVVRVDGNRIVVRWLRPSEPEGGSHDRHRDRSHRMGLASSSWRSS